MNVQRVRHLECYSVSIRKCSCCYSTLVKKPIKEEELFHPPFMRLMSLTGESLAPQLCGRMGQTAWSNHTTLPPLSNLWEQSTHGLSLLWRFQNSLSSNSRNGEQDWDLKPSWCCTHHVSPFTSKAYHLHLGHPPIAFQCFTWDMCDYMSLDDRGSSLALSPGVYHTQRKFSKWLLNE